MNNSINNNSINNNNNNGATVVEGRSARIALLRDPVQLQGRRNQSGRSGPGPTKNGRPCKNINNIYEAITLRWEAGG